MAEQPVAWTATPYHAPVLDREHQRFATTQSLLGDEAEDIFHGLAVSLDHHGHQVVTLKPDQITKITTDHVETDVPGDAVEGLPAYQEEHWYHLGWGGLFRKHPQWESGE